MHRSTYRCAKHRRRTTKHDGSRATDIWKGLYWRHFGWFTVNFLATVITLFFNLNHLIRTSSVDIAVGYSSSGPCSSSITSVTLKIPRLIDWARHAVGSDDEWNSGVHQYSSLDRARCYTHIQQYLQCSHRPYHFHSTGNQPSVLWHCWLGARNGIRPAKYWVIRCWHGYSSAARCKWIAYGPADANATSLSLALLKPRLVQPFWCQLIQAVLENKPLNRPCLCLVISTHWPLTRELLHWEQQAVDCMSNSALRYVINNITYLQSQYNNNRCLSRWISGR